MGFVRPAVLIFDLNCKKKLFIRSRGCAEFTRVSGAATAAAAVAGETH